MVVLNKNAPTPSLRSPSLGPTPLPAPFFIVLQDVADKQPDVVKLGVDNWKPRYYADKFHCPEEALAQVCRSCCVAYWQGLRWVMQYYYQGCPSWSWYYPYHYAPFASDLLGAWEPGGQAALVPGEPFKPFAQLMGVLPPVTKHALPICYHGLMEREVCVCLCACMRA